MASVKYLETVLGSFFPHFFTSHCRLWCQIYTNIKPVLHVEGRGDRGGTPFKIVFSPKGFLKINNNKFAFYEIPNFTKKYFCSISSGGGEGGLKLFEYFQCWLRNDESQGQNNPTTYLTCF